MSETQVRSSCALPRGPGPAEWGLEHTGEDTQSGCSLPECLIVAKGVHLAPGRSLQVDCLALPPPTVPPGRRWGGVQVQSQRDLESGEWLPQTWLSWRLRKERGGPCPQPRWPQRETDHLASPGLSPPETFPSALLQPVLPAGPGGGNPVPGQKQRPGHTSRR